MLAIAPTLCRPRIDDSHYHCENAREVRYAPWHHWFHTVEAWYGWLTRLGDGDQKQCD